MSYLESKIVAKINDEKEPDVIFMPLKLIPKSLIRF